MRWIAGFVTLFVIVVSAQTALADSSDIPKVAESAAADRATKANAELDSTGSSSIEIMWDYGPGSLNLCANSSDAHASYQASLSQEFRTCIAKLTPKTGATTPYIELLKDAACMPGKDVANLSGDEILALIAYGSADFYEDLNAALRTGKGLAEQKCLVDVLTSALKKLPDFHGPDQNNEADIVYRGEAPPAFLEKLYKAGPGHPPIRFCGFTSSSAYAPTDMFVEDGEDVLAIHSIHGKSISEFTHVDEEDEVLFAPGSCFQVVSFKKVDGASHVRLNEVACPANAQVKCP